jgi:acylphosphatase
VRTVEVTLEGRVQRVGMRNFVRRLAEKHRITGYVENLDDGSVRIVARGDETELALFLRKVKKGSLAVKLSGGKITRIIEQSSQELEFRGFEKR